MKITHYYSKIKWRKNGKKLSNTSMLEVIYEGKLSP